MTSRSNALSLKRPSVARAKLVGARGSDGLFFCAPVAALGSLSDLPLAGLSRRRRSSHELLPRVGLRRCFLLGRPRLAETAAGRPLTGGRRPVVAVQKHR